MTPDLVRAQLRGLANDTLLDQFESSLRSIATTEGLYQGRTMPEHEFIPYDVFRRALPLVRAEIAKRMT